MGRREVACARVCCKYFEKTDQHMLGPHRNMSVNSVKNITDKIMKIYTILWCEQCIGQYIYFYP